MRHVKRIFRAVSHLTGNVYVCPSNGIPSTKRDFIEVLVGGNVIGGIGRLNRVKEASVDCSPLAKVIMVISLSSTEDREKNL